MAASAAADVGGAPGDGDGVGQFCADELRTHGVGEGQRVAIIAGSGVGFDPERVPAGRFGVRESIVRRIEELDGGRAAFDTGADGTTVVLQWTRRRG